MDTKALTKSLKARVLDSFKSFFGGRPDDGPKNAVRSRTPQGKPESSFRSIFAKKPVTPRPSATPKAVAMKLAMQSSPARQSID